MRVPIATIDPVAILLDELDTAGEVTFGGVDLDSGARVTVTIERDPLGGPAPSPDPDRSSLILVLSIQQLQHHH